MPLNTPCKQYMETSIFTSSPEELTLMLYNGLIKWIMQAQLSIVGKDMGKAHDYIVRAKKILLNFENTLDMKYEVSKSLLSMYEYMVKRLTEANIKKDTGILAELLILAKEMRDTWSQAMKIAKHPGRVLPKSGGTPMKNPLE